MLRVLFPLLALVLAMPRAHAIVIPITHVEVAPESKSGITEEIDTAVANDDTELAEVARWLRGQAREDRKANPALEPQIIVAREGASEAPAVGPAPEAIEHAAQVIVDSAPTVSVSNAEIPAQAAKALRARFGSWFKRHYRVSFTLVRGVASTGLVSWGLLISPDIPFQAALPVGLVAGGLTAGFQYYNEAIQDWLLRARSVVGQWGRSYGIGVAYLGAIKAVSYLTGMPHDPTLWAAATSVLSTAVYGTAASAPWGLAIAESEKVSVAREPTRFARIRLMSDLKVLGVAVASAMVSVAQLMHVHVADYAIYGMTATGAITYTWTLIKKLRWKRGLRAKACDRLLTEARP